MVVPERFLTGRFVSDSGKLRPMICSCQRPFHRVIPHPLFTLSRRSPDFRQPQKVHCLHADQQHTGNLSVLVVHHCRRSAAARHYHHPLHRPRHRHGAGHLAGVRAGRERHHEAHAARSGPRQTCQSQVPAARTCFDLNNHQIKTAEQRTII